MLTLKEKIKNLLSRNVEEVIDRRHLESALKNGKKLRVKLGIDPTGEKIHIGRAVALWKLREFQELGHKIVLIIGDFTAQIGDPSDKLEKRPFLTKEQVKKNLRNYLPQIGKIIDLKKIEIRYNSDWLSKLDFRETAELAESFSVSQMLRRRAFRDRLEKGQDISLREFLYPLMQGYDSVAVKADVELGGTDQLFNLLAGREIQKSYGQRPQDIMTVQMLVGTDGRKMSTSWGNVINIVDSADEQFGKLMATHDKVIPDYFRLATRLSEPEIKKYEKELKAGANPRNIKMILAKEIVALYHRREEAEKAAQKWEKVFSKKEISGAAIPELKLKSKKISALDLVLAAGVVKSKSEGRRLIEQGAVEINGLVKNNSNEILTLESGAILKIGKRHFFRIKI